MVHDSESLLRCVWDHRNAFNRDQGEHDLEPLLVDITIRYAGSNGVVM